MIVLTHITIPEFAAPLIIFDCTAMLLSLSVNAMASGSPTSQNMMTHVIYQRKDYGRCCGDVKRYLFDVQMTHGC